MRGLIHIIGVSGFIGSHLFKDIADAGIPVVGTSRSAFQFANMPAAPAVHLDSSDSMLGGEITVIPQAQVVVFCAGLAHRFNAVEEDKQAFVAVNADLAVRCAEAAMAEGVQRFIYLSSIGVHGDGAFTAYTETSALAPRDDYSASKVLAEKRLRGVCADADMELVIIRPPMVYGPDAPGNFSRLATLTRKGVPLPLGGLVNPRSFLFIGNLISLIMRCLDHPSAAGEVFVVSDDDDITTRDFVKAVARGQGLQVRLIPLPYWLFLACMAVVGQGRAARKLAAPLTVDCSHAKKRLDWKPPFSLEEGVARSLAYQ